MWRLLAAAQHKAAGSSRFRDPAEPIQCCGLKPEALSPAGMTLRCRGVTMPRSVFRRLTTTTDAAPARPSRTRKCCAPPAHNVTPMRRHVLEALLDSHRPLGAYEIIERLAQHGRPAPITVYRALDFLRDNDLVHRIESRNAFVACCIITAATISSSSSSASAAVPSARRPAATLRKRSRPPRERPDSCPRAR